MNLEYKQYWLQVRPYVTREWQTAREIAVKAYAHDSATYWRRAGMGLSYGTTTRLIESKLLACRSSRKPIIYRLKGESTEC